MPVRRKKRTLLDALDGALGPAGASAPEVVPRGRPRKPAPPPKPKASPPKAMGAGEGELRITWNMAAAIGVVFIVFLGLSYYFGLVHGSADVAGPDRDVKLRKDLERSAVAEGGRFRVRACQLWFNRYTRSELAAEFVEYEALLVDRGYEDFGTYVYPDEGDDSTGSFILWVRRATTRAQLDEVASDLRSIVSKGRRPFESAYVAEFR